MQNDQAKARQRKEKHSCSRWAEPAGRMVGPGGSQSGSAPSPGAPPRKLSSVWPLFLSCAAPAAPPDFIQKEILNYLCCRRWKNVPLQEYTFI